MNSCISTTTSGDLLQVAIPVTGTTSVTDSFGNPYMSVACDSNAATTTPAFVHDPAGLIVSLIFLTLAVGWSVAILIKKFSI